MEKFSTSFTGYKKEEVNKFLDDVIKQVETMINNMKAKDLEIDKLKILKYGDIINKKLKSKKYEEYAELSDIIGGLTNNKIRGKYKHDNEYWKRKNALEKETFADLFAIAGGNDVKYLQVINKYLPNTLKAFDGIIRRIK